MSSGGHACVRRRRLPRAINGFSAAVQMHLVWQFKGRLAAATLGYLEVARRTLTRALEIEPAEGSIYGEMINVLRRQGTTDRATRHLAVGLRAARDPGVLGALSTPDNP